MLKKIKTLLKTKYILKMPQEADILILDKTSSQVLYDEIKIEGLNISICC